MRPVVGVDPGASGAAVMLDEHGEFERMWGPAKGEGLAWIYIATFFARDSSAVMFLEDVGGYKGQSASAAFTFGVSVGHWQMACHFFGIEPRLVDPKDWQADLDLPIAADGAKWTKTQHKKHLIAASQRLFPEIPWDTLKTVKARSGVADASLIARWGRRQLQGV